MAKAQICREVALIGTIRADGSPRISCVEPCILDGNLFLGMMWQSRKALDLLRDPRLVLHNTVCTSTGDEVEVSVRGLATEIHEPEARGTYVNTMTEWKGARFHLFTVDIDSAALIRYGHGQQSVKLWPQDKESVRSYP